MKPLALILTLAAACGACSSESPSVPSGPINSQITLAPGETGAVSTAGIGITFQGVIGDSRCPGDATCITGGDAIVRINVLPGGGSTQTFDLHTGNMQPVKYQDLTIALENLAPYPFASRPFPPSDYRATLRVTR